MPQEIIRKKLEQIGELLKELERLLAKPFFEFKKDSVIVRAAERNFQLLVDLASDINTQILVEHNQKTPDTYKESFSALENLGVLDRHISAKLIKSTYLRNILVHEYDFEEDYEKFYRSAKEYILYYYKYLKAILSYLER